MTKFSLRMKQKMEAYVCFGIALFSYHLANDMIAFSKKKRYYWELSWVDYFHTLILVSVVVVYYSIFKLSGMLNF